jgi:hypothetical protein
MNKEDFEDVKEGMKINFEVKQQPKEKALVAHSFLVNQKKKVRAVKSIIKFDVEKNDIFELNTEGNPSLTRAFYESYLHNLTEGYIRNQAEQTNEENKQVSTQTELGPPTDAGLQFPEFGIATEDKSQPLKENAAAASTVALSDKAQEKLKDPHYKDRLLRFLDEKVTLLEDVFEAQSLRNSKNSQLDELEIPQEVKEVAPNYSLNKEKVYFTDRLNAIIIIRVKASLSASKFKIATSIQELQFDT